MSEETENKGTQFIQALLEEGHDYDSIKANILALLAEQAVKAASRKLAKNPDAILETSGLVRGSMGEAAKVLRMSRYGFSKLFHGAEEMAAR